MFRMNVFLKEELNVLKACRIQAHAFMDYRLQNSSGRRYVSDRVDLICRNEDSFPSMCITPDSPLAANRRLCLSYGYGF